MRIRYVPVALLAAAALALPAAPTTPAAAGTAPPAPRSPAHPVRPAPTTPPPAPRPFVDHYVQRIETSDRVVFITIDDGTYKDPALLARLRRTHLPVSVFLTNAAASGNGLDYFRALQSAGAVIEDHTLHHPYLTTACPPYAATRSAGPPTRTSGASTVAPSCCARRTARGTRPCSRPRRPAGCTRSSAGTP
ncbi:MAG: polysaccharide deacetylase family protein [Candidatus Nanopelagicales bacterium]